MKSMNSKIYKCIYKFYNDSFIEGIIVFKNLIQNFEICTSEV